MYNAESSKKHIDWKQAAKLVSYGLTQRQLAAFFELSLDTLERRCAKELGFDLAEFCRLHKDAGKARLKIAVMEHVESGRQGWPVAMKYLMDRWKPEDFDDDVNTPPESLLTSPPKKEVKTFAEFCITAGYFEPFEKQIEMMSFGIDLTETRLLLGSRGYGKTDYITIMGIAYDLYLAYVLDKPLTDHTNLIITKSKSRNAAILEEIKNALETNGVELEKANASVIRLKGHVGKDHSVEAITIKTSMRGRHPKRIVMDDPVTDEDVSAAMRALVKRRYDEAYKLCSNVIIIGQPAHYDDLYANLRGIIKTMEVPYGSIPELDADLEAMRLAQVDETTIKMSYLLEIPKEGASIFANLNFIDSMPTGEKVAFLDPSDGGDYSALSIFRGYLNGIAVKGKAYKKAWYHCLDEIAEDLRSNDVKRLCFETNKHGDQALDVLRSGFKEAGLDVVVVGQYTETNKHNDIVAAGQYAHMIHLSKESNKAYTDQVTKYEYKAKHDDAPDSLARGLIWLGLLKRKK